MEITVSNKAKNVLDMITEGLSTSNPSNVINHSEVFMPVTVELISFNDGIRLYSVTHYKELNGDLITDPEMIFASHTYITKNSNLDESYCPLSFEMGGVTYRVAASVEGDHISKINPNELRDQIRFANTWMQNIKEQQNL